MHVSCEQSCEGQGGSVPLDLLTPSSSLMCPLPGKSPCQDGCSMCIPLSPLSPLALTPSVPWDGKDADSIAWVTAASKGNLSSPKAHPNNFNHTFGCECEYTLPDRL